MSPIEKKKFEEEFIYDLITYSEYNEIITQQRNYIKRFEFKSN